MSAEVGETIYVHGKRPIHARRTIRLPAGADVQVEHGKRLTISAGATATLEYRSANQHWVHCKDINTTQPGNPLVICLVDIDRDGTFERWMYLKREAYYMLPAPIKYDVTLVEELERPASISLRQDLLYQGLGKGVVRFSYREFTDGGMARPAFTQDLSYELDAEGKAEIGFRGLRARVIKATNQNVTVIVDRPMN